MMRKFLVPNGTAFMDEVWVDCDEFEGISMNTLEEIAMTCLVEKKGELIAVADLTDEEIQELENDGFAYVDLTVFAEECYMFRTYGLKEEIDAK